MNRHTAPTSRFMLLMLSNSRKIEARDVHRHKYQRHADDADQNQPVGRDLVDVHALEPRGQPEANQERRERERRPGTSGKPQPYRHRR